MNNAPRTPPTMPSWPAVNDITSATTTGATRNSSARPPMPATKIKTQSFLANLPLFRELGPEEIDRIADRAEIAAGTGEKIAEELLDPCDALGLGGGRPAQGGGQRGPEAQVDGSTVGFELGLPNRLTVSMLRLPVVG